MLAAVGVCLFTGLFGGLLVYFGQLVWPEYDSFLNPDTAFIDVTGRVGGPLLLQATAMLLVVANIGAGLTSQVGAARLLFGMGRENVLPPRIFARIHPVHDTTRPQRDPARYRGFPRRAVHELRTRRLES